MPQAWLTARAQSEARRAAEVIGTVISRPPRPRELQGPRLGLLSAELLGPGGFCSGHVCKLRAGVGARIPPSGDGGLPPVCVLVGLLCECAQPRAKGIVVCKSGHKSGQGGKSLWTQAPGFGWASWAGGPRRGAGGRGRQSQWVGGGLGPPQAGSWARSPVGQPVPTRRPVPLQATGAHTAQTVQPPWGPRPLLGSTQREARCRQGLCHLRSKAGLGGP